MVKMTLRRTAASVLLLTAGGILMAAGCRGKAPSGTGGSYPPPVSGVETVTAASVARETYSEALGTVRPKNTAAVASFVMGRITGLYVAEGSRVSSGALLASIDDTELKARADSAEGEVAEAEAAFKEADHAVVQAGAAEVLAVKTYERYRTLREEKAVTPQEFDEVEAKRTLAAQEHRRVLERRAQAEARALQARGRMQAARAMLSRTRITAPFDGIVAEKKADVGSMAVPGLPILVLEGTRSYRLEAGVPETQLGRLAAGSKVQVVLDADPGLPKTAVVSEIVPVVDPKSRTFTVKADLSGPGLRGGMSGRMVFATGKARVVTVPARAVFRGAGYDSVFLVTADNVARLTMVQTGTAYGDDIEVLSGVPPGSRIAVSPLDKLADGAPVEVRR
jgi:RND family efflux transporter MFP subunit